MFVQTINYTDFNGVDRTEDFHFHLSKIEVARIEAEYGTSIPEYAKAIASSQNLPELLSFIEKVILTSYGKKSSDGRSFIKTPEMRAEFEYSNAYAELFEQFITNPDLARKFGESVADTNVQKSSSAPKVVE